MDAKLAAQAQRDFGVHRKCREDRMDIKNSIDSMDRMDIRNNIDRGELLSKLEQDVPDLEGKDIWIWGVGHTLQLYLEGLKRIDRLHICGYCDNDEKKWGQVIGGKPVVSPHQLYQYQKIAVLICTPQENVVSDVGAQLDRKGIEWHRLDEAVFKLYKNEVMQCYDAMDSLLSKEIYAHLIACRMENTMPKECYISRDAYFALRPFQACGREIFVDCGAYTGDTIEQFIKTKGTAFEKIIAFEPDRGNFRAMECRVERLKKEWNLSESQIVLYNCAVGKKDETTSFLETGSMSSMSGGFSVQGDGENISEVRTVSLDRLLEEPYTFLKADIEGFEYHMLAGAKQGIRKYRPLLAICIYHNASDMFQIQQLLLSLVPEYHFAVRHHSITFDETVLYAYI